MSAKKAPMTQDDKAVQDLIQENAELKRRLKALDRYAAGLEAEIVALTDELDLINSGGIPNDPEDLD